MTAGTLLVLILGGIIGWASSAAVHAANRKAEAKALAAALWAELAVVRDTNEKFGIHDLYRRTCAEWVATGTLPDEEFWREQFNYDQTEAYPYYGSAIPKLGILGADLAAEVTAYHATERMIVTVLQMHFAYQGQAPEEQSKATAELVAAMVDEFLARQEHLVKSLDEFAHSKSLPSRWIGGRKGSDRRLPISFPIKLG